MVKTFSALKVTPQKNFVLEYSPVSVPRLIESWA